MEAITEKLDSLTTESRERLQQCEATIFHEVAAGNLRPSQVALLLAKRFTETHIDRFGYPTLCLIDLLLQKVLTAAQSSNSVSSNDRNETKAGGGKESSAAGTIARAVLRELWPMLEDPSHQLLMKYSTAIERKATRDKGIRLVKRWKERYSTSVNFEDEGKNAPESPSLNETGPVNIVTIPAGTCNSTSGLAYSSRWEQVLCVMLDKMEGRVQYPLSTDRKEGVAEAAFSVPSAATNVDGGHASLDVPSDISSSRPPALKTDHPSHSLMGIASEIVDTSTAAEEKDANSTVSVPSSSFLPPWRKVEVRQCRALLQECVHLLESLPLQRSRVYATLLLREHSHHLRPPSTGAFSSIPQSSAVGQVPKSAGSSASYLSFLLQLSNTLRKEMSATVHQENASTSSPSNITEKNPEEKEKPEVKIKKGIEVVQNLFTKPSSSSVRHEVVPPREALSHLLEVLQQQQESEDAEDTWESSKKSSSFTFSTGKVVRYVRPLLNDTALRLPIGQRSISTGGGRGKNHLHAGSNGHGVFLQTAPSRASVARVVRGGKDGSLAYYYPTASVSASASTGSSLFARPFRVPAAVLQGSSNGRGTRISFPSVAEWMDNTDMGDLAQYDHRIRVGNNMENVSVGSGDLRAGGKRLRNVEDD